MQKSKRTRISTPDSVLWLNHIARYAQSLTTPNLTHCCDPDVNKFCGMGSKGKKEYVLSKQLKFRKL